MRRPRIKDVAARAGVAVSTVSVVLNDAAGARVSPQTRGRILAAADELGYATNSIARSLRTRRTQTIGFVSDVIATTPYAGQMIQGAQDAAWRAGYLLLLVNTGGEAELRGHAIRALRQRQVDGVIYATMYHQALHPPPELRDTKLVLLDAEPLEGRVPHVVPHERRGGYDAVTELLAAGHRRIGFATESRDVPAASGRLAGYREAIASRGIAYDADLIRGASGDTAGGYQATAWLLDLPEPPTGVFCFNDRMAMGAYRAAAERGLRVPDDLSIVGFDDLDLIAPELAPPLTTLALPHYAMGEWAARALLGLMDPRHDEHDEAQDGGEERDPRDGYTMPCPLVRRKSVGPPPR